MPAYAYRQSSALYPRCRVGYSFAALREPGVVLSRSGKVMQNPFRIGTVVEISELFDGKGVLAVVRWDDGRESHLAPCWLTSAVSQAYQS